LFASDLPSILAVIVRFTEAGTNAFMMRFIRPGMILDRFSRSALRPSDTHCSTLSGFIGMVRGSKPRLASTRRVCQRGRHDGNVDAQKLELVVERFPETVDIRLGATVIRQERNPNFRAHRPYEDKAAPASLGEFRAEMVGDVQMRHRIEPQSRLKQLPIELQELSRIWCWHWRRQA
jgi:hypothetical protein